MFNTFFFENRHKQLYLQHMVFVTSSKTLLTNRSGAIPPGPKLKKWGCQFPPPIFGPFWGQLGATEVQFLNF
jgi:hypothetical protein